MDLFEQKRIAPMLIGESGEPFDDPDCIYELKLDGERAIAYLEPGGTELRNKRNKRMLPVFPELAGLHKQARGRCILDGEYVVLRDGKPWFAEIQRRSLMSNAFRIGLAAKQYPVSFVAFDILYLDGKDLTKLPLMERKAILGKTVQSESERFALSRYIESAGKALYNHAAAQSLEGVVAKYKHSKYHQGKRTKEWIKFKNLLDDDFVVCGYIHKDNNMASIVLGQYDEGKLVYKGHVTLGVSGSDFIRVKQYANMDAPPFEVPEGHGNERAEWVLPELVCTVRFMERTANGGMRQPVFKGLRDDKAPEECLVHK